MISRNVVRAGLERVGAEVRTALYFANFTLWLALVPLAWWPGRPPREALLRFVKRCARWSFRVYGIPLEIEGVSRLGALEEGQSVLYIANHQSWLDQPAVICAADHLLHFLGAEKYFSFPVLGRVLDTYGCVPVPKGRSGALLELVAARLERGDSFLFYPEGTRTETDDFLPFRTGAFVLSAQTGTPIVPLYVYGARGALPRARPMREVRAVPMRVVVGEPYVVPPSFLDDPDTTAYREEFVRQWRAQRAGYGR